MCSILKLIIDSSQIMLLMLIQQDIIYLQKYYPQIQKFRKMHVLQNTGNDYATTLQR